MSDGAEQGAPWALTRDENCVTGETCAHLRPQEAYAVGGEAREWSGEASNRDRWGVALGVRRTDSSLNVRARGRRWDIGSESGEREMETQNYTSGHEQPPLLFCLSCHSILFTWWFTVRVCQKSAALVNRCCLPSGSHSLAKTQDLLLDYMWSAVSPVPGLCLPANMRHAITHFQHSFILHACANAIMPVSVILGVWEEGWK